jgi:hypothetical protein
LKGSRRRENLRAFTMVTLRRRFFDEELGNKFGIVFLTLPLDCRKPLDCLEDVKGEMDGLKASAFCSSLTKSIRIIGELGAARAFDGSAARERVRTLK